MDLEFTRYVSSVPGRVVTRWDAAANAYLGARVTTAEERAAGAEPIVWDPERVIPLTAQFCQRYGKELNHAIRFGDLVERTRADFDLWLELEQLREAERLAAETSPSNPPTE